MSATDALLIFLDDHGEVEGWLRLVDGAVAARGAGLDGLSTRDDPDAPEPVPVVAVVAGDAVSLHWLEIPAGLAPAQAIAAARLMASEASAQPIADMHVAVAPDSETDLEAREGVSRIVALVPALTMAGWLGRLRAAGLDPDVLLPEPLLLKAPAEGFVRYDRGATSLYRGPADAFTLEPELAALVIADAPVAVLDDNGFEAGLADAVAEPAINLRQGAFAKRRRWQVDWKGVRRLALLALGILVVTLAIQIAALLRYTYGADALEAETQRVAAAALPAGIPASEAGASLERRLTDLRGSGVGYAAIASALFAAVRATPNVELTALDFGRDGSLRATVQGDSPASLSALQQRVEADGLVAAIGATRSGGGRPTAELRVTIP